MKKKVFVISLIIVLFAFAGFIMTNSINQNNGIKLKDNEAVSAENPWCPNGCLTELGDGCLCYEFFEDRQEASWD